MSKKVQKTNGEVVRQRWLQIVADKLQTMDKNTVIGKRFGVSSKTVQRALDWGHDEGLFEINIRERLLHHVMGFNGQLERIREEWDLAVDETRDEETGERTGPMNPMHFSVLSREERETRIKVLELEGLYRNVLNVRAVGMGEEEKDVEVTWRIVDADED